MKPFTRHSAFAAVIALILQLAAGPAGSAPTEQVDTAIRYLIGHVAGSDLTFVRNASEYSPGEAAEHLQRKYRHFRDDIATPEDFITLCASKSLLSGKPYLVIDSEGKELLTGDWLRAALADYHGRSQ